MTSHLTNKERILKAMIPEWEYTVWDLQKVYYDVGRILRQMAQDYKRDKFAPPIVKRNGTKYVYYKKLY